MPYLRHKPTGDLYVSTPLLLDRGDMEEITNKQAAGIKSAATRVAKTEAGSNAADDAKKTVAKAKREAKKADTKPSSAEEAEAAALSENDKAS